MNFSSSIGNLKNTMSGFTLVELIVVITILAILGTIGFVSIQGYSSSARESGRLSDLTNLEKSLEVRLTQNGYVPPPDASSITLYASGAIIGYQGYAGANVLSGIGMSSNTLDPLDKKYYTYATNASRTKYQLLGLMENNSTLAINDIGNSLIPVAYAGYDTRYPVTKGNALGVLLGSTGATFNQPIQELYNAASFTGVDVVNTSTEYLAVFSKVSSISGTGASIITTISSYSPDRKNLSSYDSSLVGYWDMETLSGTLLKDFSKQGNDGVCYNSGTVVNCGGGGGPQFVSGNGKNGKAMSFDGLNTYTRHLFSPYDFENQSFTVDFIIKPDANNSGVAFAEGAVGGGWAIWPSQNPASAVFCSFIKNINNNQSQYCASSGVTPNTWNHFTIITTTSTTDTLYIRNSKIYINGVLLAGRTTQEGFVYSASTTPFSIGGRDGGSSNAFNGLIDEVRIYKRALSSSEVLALYNAMK